MKQIYSPTIWNDDRRNIILNDIRNHTMDEIYNGWLKFIDTDNVYWILATIEELMYVHLNEVNYIQYILEDIQEYLEILE